MGDQLSIPVWSAGGGESGPLLVLLHGSGATSAVWAEVLRRLPPGQRWLTVDLPGHGRSGALRSYSTGAVAAAVAAAVDPAEPCLVVGHSLGGQVGLALTDPLFGLTIGATVCLSVKIEWTAEELEQRGRRALAPRKVLADRDEAERLFAKVSGLAQSPTAPTAEQLASGVTDSGSGFMLAQDPLTAGVPPLPATRLTALAASAGAPVRLACGDADPMTTPLAMSVLGTVETVAGAGHNLHLTHADDVARIVREELTFSSAL